MIASPDMISVFYLEVVGEGASYMMTAYCNYCHGAIVEDVPESVVHKLRENGVNVFSFFTGELEDVIKVP